MKVKNRKLSGNFVLFVWIVYLYLFLNEEGVVTVCQVVKRKSKTYGKKHNLGKESIDIQEWW